MNKIRNMHKYMALLVTAILLASLFSGCLWISPVTTGPGDEVVDPPSESPEDEARRRQEEWQRRNEELKQELGQFYVPLLPLDQPENPPVKAKALYFTGHTVGYQERYRANLKLIEDTELNAVVIDIKDDHGRMCYRSDIPIINEVDAYYQPVPISDIREVLADLKSKNIYPIARIVVFKDPYLAKAKPEWAIRANSGGIWTEKGVAWINPFQEEVWDYNIAIAKEAALLGFREIQFDYIRFPENARRVDQEAYYPGQDGRIKDDAVKGFLQRAREQLADYNVHFACDVFGVIATSWGDADQIGQIWETFAPEVDYQCPMIYPSHYGPGYFGYPVPDAVPAGTVTRALTDALKRNAPLAEPAIIRPWLQSFTATWIRGHIPYGPYEVRQQIDAALALGIEEYMIWDPSNVYPRGGFYSEEEAERREDKVRENKAAQGWDALNRTAEKALECYLQAVKEKDWREAYSLQITSPRLDGNQYREWLNGSKGKLDRFEVNSLEKSGEGWKATLDLVIISSGEERPLVDEQWTLVQENNLWRVKPSSRFIKYISGEQDKQQEVRTGKVNKE